MNQSVVLHAQIQQTFPGEGGRRGVGGRSDVFFCYYKCVDLKDFNFSVG